MKELSIEEKAKRYDEAIEKARNIVNSINVGLIGKDSFESVFPELKESEDERIRKELIDFLEYYRLNNVLDSKTVFLLTDSVAWLERQGEQKSFAKYKVGDTIYYDSFGRLVSFVIANIVEDGTDNPMYEDKDGNSVFQNDIVEQNHAKFKAGDWVVSDLDKMTRYISEVHNDKYNNYYVIKGDVETECDINEYDRLHHLWTIQDAKDGDVLTYNDSKNNIWVCIFKEYANERVYDYCTLDKESFWEHGNWNYLASFSYTPATKEQRDLLFQKMKEAGYEWDAEKKELKEIEQKLVWSERDEKLLNDAISLADECDDIELRDWFKSLRPQNRWKVVDKKIYVKEPALVQKKDKSEPCQGFVICYDHTLTPDVYERYIMLSDINCHSWWKPSDTEINILQGVIDGSFKPENVKVTLTNILEQLKKLREE